MELLSTAMASRMPTVEMPVVVYIISSDWTVSLYLYLDTVEVTAKGISYHDRYLHPGNIA